MRVDKNYSIFHPNIGHKSLIKKGDILTGKILDIKGKYLLLDIKGLGTVHALSNIDLKACVGKEVRFALVSFDGEILKIKPDLTNREFNNLSSLFKKEDYVDSIFKEFNIEKNPLNKEFIKSLMEYNVTLNEENILTGTGLINNIKNMIKIYEERKLSSSNGLNYLNAMKININGDNYSIDDEYIFLLCNLLKDEEIKLLPKVMAFLIKYNIKPTFNNIVNFIELNLDMELFSKDYEILKNIINKEFTNYNKNIIISNEVSKTFIEESKNIYLYNMNQILKFLKNHKFKASKEIYNTIKRFEEKLELIKELNSNLTFIFLPIELKKDINSLIALVKKKRHKYDYQDTVNIFINIKTKNFGKVEVFVKAINMDLNIEFNNLNKEDIEYFRSKEEYLRSILKSIGYKVVSIKYPYKKNLNILDTLAVNPNPLFSLDIKVWKMKDKKKNKIDKAVALSYKEGYNAPKVLAKGSGEVAKNILKLAEESKIKIYKDEDLVEDLIKLDIYEEIPPSLYEAVANIIYYIHKLDRKKEEQHVQ